MSTYFFVPGYGRTEKDWDRFRSILQSHGHKTYSITLSKPRKSSLTKHIAEVYKQIIDEDFNNVILVGHSYSGFVITGVADKIPERINKLIFIDTLIPEDGKSIMDFFRAAKTKLLKFGVIPFKPLSEPLKFDTLKFNEIDKTYIRCSKSQFLKMLDFIPDYFKMNKVDKCWKYFELNSGHFCMNDSPNELADIILQVN
ncbi:MAG TPA: alpha/beta hydrolase [Victivallales bacterium]|nr:alpha/beta hydrolase [Victivallales bacterium]